MKDFSEYRNIWVFVETEHGEAKNVGYELLNAARPLADGKGCELVAVVIGHGIDPVCREALCYGADSVLAVEGEVFETYSTDAFSLALIALIEKYKPDTVLFGATNNGRDLGPKVACHIKTGLTADCTGLGLNDDGENIAWTRPTFGGNLMATIICPESRPQMGTVRPGVFRKGNPDPSAAGPIVKEDIHIPPEDIRTRIIYQADAQTLSLDLEDAEIIVAGGRGMGSAENFRVLKEFADEIGAYLGCSRAVVDAGWLPHTYQVGQSGKTVAPKIYFAVGISGAIQHLAGITGAETVIAINKDPNAPIFDIADYCIVGDLNEVIPALTRAYRKMKE
ncbi:MAG: electron transfer flavoprotein subunit alpha/FixB family protein [Firmicutes bacterium]|nr:electron transfer flavoprotein subunit alpha/FixB family protein [Bacillota bacterium]